MARLCIVYKIARIINDNGVIYNPSEFYSSTAGVLCTSRSLLHTVSCGENMQMVLIGFMGATDPR